MHRFSAVQYAAITDYLIKPRLYMLCLCRMQEIGPHFGSGNVPHALCLIFRKGKHNNIKDKGNDKKETLICSTL